MGFLRVVFFRKWEVGFLVEIEDVGLRERWYLGGWESVWIREADCFLGVFEVSIINL